MDTLFIPVILGTGHEGRQSEKVADYVLKELKERDAIETQLVDVRHVALCVTGGNAEGLDEWKQTVIRADGFIIVAPEYNHGYPGELKIALDALYSEYKAKPVGICGVSSGAIGGARMIELLVPVLVTVGLTPVQRTVPVGPVGKVFADDGTLADPAFKKRFVGLFEEVFWYAKVLKEGREKYPELFQK